MNTTACHRTFRGFTLLEAVVALSIFSICAIALYGWLAVNVNALVRVDARAAAVRDGRAAVQLLEAVNPMTDPSGERTLPGGLVVSWTGTELERKPGIGPSGNPLIFDLSLYELDVVVTRDGREVNRFNLRRAGWKTVGSLHNDQY